GRVRGHRARLALSRLVVVPHADVHGQPVAGVGVGHVALVVVVPVVDDAVAPHPHVVGPVAGDDPAELVAAPEGGRGHGVPAVAEAELQLVVSSQAGREVGRVRVGDLPGPGAAVGEVGAVGHVVDVVDRVVLVGAAARREAV